MSLGAFPYEQAFSVGVSYDLCFAPDESALFVVARRLQRWDTVTGRRTHSVAWSNGSGIDVSPDGRRVVAMNTRGDAIMLDAASMEQLWVVRGRGVGEGTAPVFSPDGSAFVTGSRGGDLVVRDAETGDVVLHERAAWITGIACSPNRKLFGISRYAEHESAIELRCWPFSDHDGRQLLVGAPVGEVALDAAGRIAASTRSGVAIYHVSNRSLLRRGAAEHSSVGGLAWAPDGELVAVDRFDNTVLGMDDQTLTPTWSLELPYACAAAYSRWGALLALGSWERGIVASRTGAVTTAGDPTPIDDDHTSAGTQPRNDEEQWIIGYIETEANESVIRLDKVASKQSGTIHHDVWDVRCESSRWWAITEPLAGTTKRTILIATRHSRPTSASGPHTSPTATAPPPTPECDAHLRSPPSKPGEVERNASRISRSTSGAVMAARLDSVGDDCPITSIRRTKNGPCFRTDAHGEFGCRDAASVGFRPWRGLPARHRSAPSHPEVHHGRKQ